MPTEPLLRVPHPLVGEQMVEVNPRISTIVHQEDLNLPYLDLERALGETSDDKLATVATPVSQGRIRLRYFVRLEGD